MMLNIDKVIETNFISLYPEMNLEEILYKAVTKSSRNNFPVVNDKNEFLGVLLLDDIRSIMFDKKIVQNGKSCESNAQCSGNYRL